MFKPERPRNWTALGAPPRILGPILMVVFACQSLLPAARAKSRYTVTDLGGGFETNGGFSQANGINNRGQVVGEASAVAGTTHAFLYSHGQRQDIGTLGGIFSQAFGINDSGQIVGLSAITGLF